MVALVIETTSGYGMDVICYPTEQEAIEALKDDFEGELVSNTVIHSDISPDSRKARMVIESSDGKRALIKWKVAESTRSYCL